MQSRCLGPSSGVSTTKESTQTLRPLQIMPIMSLFAILKISNGPLSALAGALSTSVSPAEDANSGTSDRSGAGFNSVLNDFAHAGACKRAAVPKKAANPTSSILV